MDDLTEIYIYIYIYRENEFQIMTCTTTVSWAPLSWKKLRVKKKKQKGNVEKFWKKNLKYILKHLSPFFYNSISNDLSYNTQRFDA